MRNPSSRTLQLLRWLPVPKFFILAPVLASFTLSLQADSAPGSAVKSSADPVAQYRGPSGDADQLAFAMVNGVRLAYRLEGAGIPVVFVHGEGYSHELWTEQIEDFSAQYQFISYDRRGHGSSDDPLTGYSETAHADRTLVRIRRNPGVGERDHRAHLALAAPPSARGSDVSLARRCPSGPAAHPRMRPLRGRTHR